MEISYSSYPMDVLRSSPYLSAIARISSRITPSSFFLSARIAFNSCDTLPSDLHTRSRASRVPDRSAHADAYLRSPVPVHRIRRETLHQTGLLLPASFWLPRMMLITSSILSSAISKPCKIWARSSALFNSYLVRLVTTSS